MTSFNNLKFDLSTLSWYKVEAKRAVPRSEMTTSTISGAPGTPLMAGKIGGPMSSPSMEHFKSSPGMAGGVGDDMGYNKIFVGGLHYDTRDRKFETNFRILLE